MESRDKSEFNDAIGYLRRIDICFYQIMVADSQKDSSLYFDALRRLTAELSTYMDKEETEKYKKLIDDINKQVVSNLSNRKRYNAEIPATLYNSLYQWELDLRNIYNRSGLQTRHSEDPSKAIG